MIIFLYNKKSHFIFNETADIYHTFKTTHMITKLRDLHDFVMLSGQAFDRLVTVSSEHLCSSTSALSTSSSSRGLISFDWDISS